MIKFEIFVVLMVELIVVAVIEIRSDTSLAEAVQILAENKILSAPVVDVDAPQDATWMDRYIGIVEFAGIAVWILQQVNLPLIVSVLSFVECFMFSLTLFRI